MIPGLIYSLVAALEMQRDMWPDKKTTLCEGMYQKVIQPSGTFGGPSGRSVCPCRRRAAAIRIPTEKTLVGEGHRTERVKQFALAYHLVPMGWGNRTLQQNYCADPARDVVGLAHVCSWSLGK